jgi:hypothetical protein
MILISKLLVAQIVAYVAINAFRSLMYKEPTKAKYLTTKKIIKVEFDETR